MNELLFILSGLAGALLGLFFFGGLWWTVRKGLTSQRPGLWFVGSLLTRTVITLSGFYLIGHDHGPRLLVCLFGFIIGRYVVLRLTRPSIALNKFSQ